MSRFDLYATSSRNEFLLDLQTDLLDIQSTRMMAPVLPKGDVAKAIKDLHPEFQIDGHAYLMATHLMGAVPIAAVDRPVANLGEKADEITRALDLLFQGY